MIDNGGQALRIGAVQLLDRSAVARQIQGDDLPPFGQSRLREHPGVEIGAEAVQQQDRDTVALAEREVAQPQAGGLQFARPYGFGIDGRFG